MWRFKILWLLCLLPFGSPAEDAGTYLVNLLRNGDFSEDQDGDGKPDWWLQVYEPDKGLKSYGKVHLDEKSVRLETNGTDVALQNHAQTLLRVDTSSSYQLLAEMQTAGCRERDVLAGLGIQWLDADKEILSEEWLRQRHEESDGARPRDWLPLTLNLDRVPEKAVWARVRFGLFHGPDGLQGVSLRGQGWFRGMQLTRRPRIVLTSEREDRLLYNQQTHPLLIEIEGLERGIYHCVWEVSDLLERSVTRGEYEIRTLRGERKDSRTIQMDLGERLGYFRFGMRLETRDETRAVIARETLVFGVGSPQEEALTRRVSEQMGIDLQTRRLTHCPEKIVSLVEQTRAHNVNVTLWNSQFNSGAPQVQTPNGELISRLNTANIRVTAVLGYIPPEVPRDFLGTSIYSLLSSRRSFWEPLAQATGTHYGEIDQWILGSEFDTSMIEQGSQAVAATRDLRRLMGISGIKLGLPVGDLLTGGPARSIYPRVFDGMELFTFFQPAGGTEAEDYLKQADFDARLLAAGETFQNRLRPERHVRLELKDSSYPVAERLESLVFGTLHLLNHGADRVSVRLHPQSGGLVDRQNQFLPEFFAFRTLTEIMAPLTILGDIDLPMGSRNLVLEFNDKRRGPRLAMILWNPDKEVTEDLYLGDKMKVLDLMGNRDLLPVVRHSNQIPVGRLPVFLIDLDEELLRTRLSVSLSRPLIDSRIQDTRESIEITNFLNEDLSGELEIIMPEGWTLQGTGKSRIHTMSTNDRRIVGFRVRPDALETTDKSVRMMLHFTFDGMTRPPMTIFKRFHFGSRSIQMTFTFPDPEDQNAEWVPVEMTVRNVGGGQMDLIAYNATLGRQADDRFLGMLPPTDVRNERFVIRRSDIEAGRVTLGVRENGGFGRFVNRHLSFVNGQLRDVP